MNEPPEFVIQGSVRAPAPFQVLDAAVGRWLASEIIAFNDTGRLGLHRSAVSSGSSQHVLTHSSTPVWQINLRAVDTDITVIQFVVFQDTTSEILNSRLAAFWQWFTQQQRDVHKLPNIERLEVDSRYTSYADLRANFPQRKRRGPTPEPHNMWAREQARLGRSIDDLLPEYMHRSGKDPSNEEDRRHAREALRKTIQRAPK